MKTLLVSLLTLVAGLSTCMPSPAHAAILGAPYLPEIDSRFNSLETGVVGSYGGFTAGSLPLSALVTGVGATGVQPEYIAKAIMNMAVAAGTYNTGIVLPANSIITQVFMLFKAAITPSGTTTAFQCLTANDLFTATDETGQSAGALLAGTETGTAATMLNASAGCTVKMVTAVHTGTAGTVDLFIKYTLAN